MSNLSNSIEAVLFAGARPFSVRRLAELCDASSKDVDSALEELEHRLEESSVMLQRAAQEVQLVTRPEYAEIVKQVVRDEVSGELSRPSLETLTILAYRGPLTRPELEQIRGVQSSIILRNLMIRGLVEEKEDARVGQATYAVTFDLIRHLGLKSVEELPDYETLRGHENVVDILKDLETTSDASSSPSPKEDPQPVTRNP